MGLIPQLNRPLVVVEVDPGIDDAWALLVMFGAWKLGLIKILAVVCSNGNMDLTQACENTKKIMDACDVYDFDIPLFTGVATAVVGDIPKDFFFGKDGFGDINSTITTKPRVTFPAIHFAEYITSLSKLYNKQISYLSLGSLTFLMTVLLQQPDFKFKDIWIMGGNNLGVDYQEWNFHVDPEAAHFILRQWKEMPLYLGTFQNCQNIRPTIGWRKNVLGKINSKIVRLLNQAEQSKLVDKKDTDIWLQYDPIVAVALAFQDSITGFDDIKVNVTLGTDPKKRSILVKGDSKVKSIKSLKLEDYKSILEKTAKILGN